MSTYQHFSGAVDIRSFPFAGGTTIDGSRSSSTTVYFGSTLRVSGQGLAYNQFGITSGLIQSLEQLDPNTGTVLQSISDINKTAYIQGSGLTIGPASLFYGVDQTYSNGNFVRFAGAVTGNDTLFGNASNEGLWGYAGNDLIEAGGGNDDIYGDAHPFDAAAGSDTLRGGIGDDRLWGGRGNDFLEGGDGNDNLTGNDHVSFDAGYQSYIYVPGFDTINGGAGDDLIWAQMDNSAPPSSPNSTYYSLAGGVIADGGAGVDTLYVNLTHLSGNITVNWRDPGTINTFVDGSSFQNIERYHLVLGAGNDTVLDGLYGDVIWTGAGNDTVYYGGSRIVATGPAGNIGSTINLGAGNDLFIVQGTFDGKILAEDTVNLFAGEGFDEARVDYTSLTRNVGFALPNDFERLLYYGGSGEDAVSGTGGADEIRGGAGNDQISGGRGNDQLLGGVGRDYMAGGEGDDSYEVDSTGDIVEESAGQGFDTVYASVGYTLRANVESLVLTGSATNGTGNDLNNYLVGTAGSNLLDGGAGADIMSGGGGSDTYVVENPFDFVSENAGEGFDTIYAYVNTVLPANVESLVLVGSAVYGTGNAESNYLTGNSSANVLDGGGGADIMSGGAGNDTYLVDNPYDYIAEESGGGFDTVYANSNYALGAQVDNLILYGSAVYGWGNTGDNYISGNENGNFINGQGGYDHLSGGAGSDIFQMVGNFGVQVITDFVAGAGTQDAVTFSTPYITSFETVMANSAQIGGDTYIGDGLGNQVVLVGVNRSALSADDFGYF